MKSLHIGGIIKEKTPVLLGYTNKEAENVIKTYPCKNMLLFETFTSFNVEVNLKGLIFSYNQIFKYSFAKYFATYEARDASIAIEAIKILREVFPVNEKT